MHSRVLAKCAIDLKRPLSPAAVKVTASFYADFLWFCIKNRSEIQFKIYHLLEAGRGIRDLRGSQG